MAIRLYRNAYQLIDNGIWTEVERGTYDGNALRLLLLGGKARLLSDGDTVIAVNSNWGYKLRLSEHNPQLQNEIIDVLTPLFIQL